MLRSKIIKTIILGTSITLLSSGLALASTGGVQPSVLPAEDKMMMDQGSGISDGEILKSEQMTPEERMKMMGPSAENTAVYELQRKIDQYVFGDHMKEIEQKGFMVTHTGPMNDYVEVGITPYTEENANYLYGIFGRDRVKVVEGQQAALLAATSGPMEANKASDMPLAATDANTFMPKDDAEKSSAIPLPLIYTAGGIIVLGGGLAALKRKQKAATK